MQWSAEPFPPNLGLAVYAKLLKLTLGSARELLFAQNTVCENQLCMRMLRRDSSYSSSSDSACSLTPSSLGDRDMAEKFTGSFLAEADGVYMSLIFDVSSLAEIFPAT